MADETPTQTPEAAPLTQDAPSLSEVNELRVSFGLKPEEAKPEDAAPAKIETVSDKHAAIAEMHHKLSLDRKAFQQQTKAEREAIEKERADNAEIVALGKRVKDAQAAGKTIDLVRELAGEKVFSQDFLLDLTKALPEPDAPLTREQAEKIAADAIAKQKAADEEQRKADEKKAADEKAARAEAAINEAKGTFVKVTVKELEARKAEFPNVLRVDPDPEVVTGVVDRWLAANMDPETNDLRAGVTKADVPTPLDVLRFLEAEYAKTAPAPTAQPTADKPSPTMTSSWKGGVTVPPRPAEQPTRPLTAAERVKAANDELDRRLAELEKQELERAQMRR